MTREEWEKVTTITPDTDEARALMDEINIRVSHTSSTYKPFLATARAHMTPEGQECHRCTYREIYQSEWSEEGARAAMVARIRADELGAFQIRETQA